MWAQVWYTPLENLTIHGVVMLDTVYEKYIPFTSDVGINFLTGYNRGMSYLSWVKLALGVWVFVSPWVLGFAAIPLALWSNVISGTGIVILTLWSLFGKKPGETK